MDRVCLSGEPAEKEGPKESAEELLSADAFGKFLKKELLSFERRLMAEHCRSNRCMRRGAGADSDAPQAPPLSTNEEFLIASDAEVQNRQFAHLAEPPSRFPHESAAVVSSVDWMAFNAPGGLVSPRSRFVSDSVDASMIQFSPYTQDACAQREAAKLGPQVRQSPLSSRQRTAAEPPSRQRTAAEPPSRQRTANTLADDEAGEAPAPKEKEKKKAAQPANLFADIAKMKEDMKNKPKYDVKDFYHKAGYWQSLARNALFENTTLGVIAFNALWMAIDTDNNTAETLLSADMVFQIAEHAFCFYFSFEWFTRFMAFQRKRNGLRDFWFVFDSILVFMMVMETWVLTGVMLLMGGAGGSSPLGNASILRLLRLARLSRMARMLRSMPELLILIKGMVAAMRSVGFVLLLLVIMMYVFSIAFVQLMKNTPSGEAWFPGIPTSMYTLLVAGTFMDNITQVANELGADSMVCAALFFVFVGLSALTVMNMLIGVLCEVVSSVAECEKESMAIAGMSERMDEIWKSIDEDGTGQLSKDEFVKIMTNKDAWEALSDVDVDPSALVNLADQIFEPEGMDGDEADEPTLTIEDFTDVVWSLRASNHATVKDMNDLRKWMSGQMLRQHKFFEQLLVHSLSSVNTSANSKSPATTEAKRTL